jgi:hypothetical protein
MLENLPVHYSSSVSSFIASHVTIICLSSNAFNSFSCGLILAISTPHSLKANEEKEIYEVISESRGTKYTVNFEDGTCTCADFKNRGEVC